MPEILTESFCERCGTRYTFESAAPKARLGRFKTLSKGLKNFVLDDATSLDDALASARNEESRESTTQQLDAFHKTFNFCMSCRQYTCANCWNDAEGQCLSCSPAAGRGLSAAWAQDAGDAPAWATRSAEPAGIEPAAWPSTDRLRPEPTEVPAEEPWPLAALAGRLAPAESEPVVEEEQVVAAEPEPIHVVEPEPEPIAAGEPRAPAGKPSTLEERVAAAAANTAELMAMFRPGQSLDDALAAYEASVEAAELAPEPPPAPAPAPVIAAAPEPKREPVAWPAAEPPPIASPEPEYVPEYEPVAAQAETSWPEPEPPAWPEPEPEPAAWPEEAPESVPWPEAEPEPVVWAQPEPEPPVVEPVRPPTPPARPARDIVEVPTWNVTAPEAPVNGHPSEALRPAAHTDRQAPQWPNQPAESFLAARLAARKAGDDMWAASSAEVLGPTAHPGVAPSVGVQACVSCGLSLSATARFCRRCGTRQG